jgi:hypothetical protein
MIANPGEHPSILGLMCKVPWVVKNWPIQKLINRAQARSRFLTFSSSFLNLNPLSGVPLRALPSSPLVQLIDEELVWIMLDRLPGHQTVSYL